MNKDVGKGLECASVLIGLALFFLIIAYAIKIMKGC